MDPATLATITGLASAAKMSVEAIRTALGAKGSGAGKAAKETLALVDGLQARVIQLQEIALRLGRELGEAQEENARLLKQNRQEEERAADREKYELRRVGRAVVIVLKENPEIQLCPTCFEAGAKVYLTTVPRNLARLVTHLCPKCSATFWLRS